MNLRNYLRTHEKSLKSHLLESSPSHNWIKTLEQHKRLVHDLQHERLIHLLVTLSCALFLLCTTGFVLIHPSRPVLLLVTLFFILLIPYIIHYFYLENTVQRWYQMTDQLEERCSRSSSSPETIIRPSAQ